MGIGIALIFRGIPFPCLNFSKRPLFPFQFLVLVDWFTVTKFWRDFVTTFIGEIASNKTSLFFTPNGKCPLAVFRFPFVDDKREQFPGNVNGRSVGASVTWRTLVSSRI